MIRKLTPIIVFCGLFLICDTILGEDVGQYPFAIGLHYTGVQFAWVASPKWTFEGRYTIGRSTDDEGEVASEIFGARCYFFPVNYPVWKPYAGGQGGWIESVRDTDDHRAQGWMAGGFLGVRRDWGKRWSLLMDVGPTLFSLQENVDSRSDRSVEFVADLSVCFRFGGKK